MTTVTSLPRSLDVQVSVSRPQVESTTELNVPVGLALDTGFRHGPGRVQFFTSLAAAESVFAADTQAFRMASAGFAQNPRANTIAIGAIFNTAQAGYLTGLTLAPLSTWTAVTDGSLALTIDGVTNDIAAQIDFSSAADLDAVAALIQVQVRAVASGGFTLATVVQEDGVLFVTSGTTGVTSIVTNITTAASLGGTDVSTAIFLAGTEASIVGYTPSATDLAGEMGNTQLAARAQGRFIYGWSFDLAFRANPEVYATASTYLQARRGLGGFVSNDPSSLLASTTTDIGSRTTLQGNQRAVNIYSTTQIEYPDMAMLAYALHVDYAAEDSVITVKFKNLVGITPADIEETDLAVLNSKRYNALTLTGETSRVFREGITASAQYFIDSVINFDNFQEEIQVAVYNVFLRNNRVGFSLPGVARQYNAIRQVCNRYIFNGTLSSRPVDDTTRSSGQRIDPAFTIAYTPLRLISASQRASRAGPPFTVVANETGAIHSTSIAIQANQ